MSTLVTGSNDALDILSDAASILHNATITPLSGPPSTQPAPPSSDAPTAVPAESNRGSQSGVGFVILSLSEPTDATLNLWDKCRFVRQGWFTSQEAVTCSDLFFKYLSPLTAVTIDHHREHDSQMGLICEESMLCCTVLMIASRFFMLPGEGGASRSHLIHNRLWQHCELMIKRIMLGQEKISTAKMRVVGTIESLLLISDWRPRAVHFPPDTEGWDAVFIDTEYDREHRKRTNDQDPLLRWQRDVFEPAKRASRMSWMLLGLATNLAYELGVLPHDHHQTSNVAPSSDELRKFRAQKLLYTCMTQTATKLGYHSVLPESIAITVSRSVTADGNVETQRSWNAYMNAYLELTRLSKLVSSMFFQSAAQLQSVLQNDNYPDLVEHFQASLSSWGATHALSLENVLEPLKDSLLIELHHLRACIGAIAIHAVVQRASGSDTSVARADGLASYMTAKYVGLLQEVISDSSMVLEIATVSSFKTHLGYAPARIRLNVISASAFLLKAISLGSPATDVETALHTLDRCTTTFKAYPPDDMDFAMRYADLTDRHALNLKNRFVSSSGQQRGTSGGSNNTVSSLAISTGPVSDMEQPGFWRDFQFDLSLAPFGDSVYQLSQGFDIDSLNFLWNLSDRSV
ncbi:hypothetical protein C8035_v005360 [Colletotrichum spinosum]|uniref:Transcription factor domain-containing protein n=1 Tax=Colletotrichum spinosum TaxID=1347390 RepID=A0A4R8QMV8_9PEZI|nr:hypothetical protein C8035_v005360 [Colletotrichum spinosum]